MKLIGRFILLSVPFLVFSCSRCSGPGIFPGGPEKKATTTITVMTYNTENLFDGVDNGTEYRDYDPGEEQWSTEDFHAKMLAVAEVIGTAVPKGPDIVALQEIENENVLETLRTEGVKNLGYRFSAIVEAPEAAVNTGLLSRFPVAAVRSHRLHVPESERLRNILEVEIVVDGRTLYLLNNHWKSKSGGAEETEPLRIAAAELAERRITEIMQEHLEAGMAAPDIVLCGDLNENHNEAARVDGAYAVALVAADGDAAGEDAAGADSPGLCITGSPNAAAAGVEGAAAAGVPVLYSPWFEAPSGGSYLYRNSWETIDHFLLSGGLFDEAGFSYAGFTPLCSDFLLGEDGGPLRWNRTYMSGYSDHLPLLLELTLH